MLYIIWIIFNKNYEQSILTPDFLKIPNGDHLFDRPWTLYGDGRWKFEEDNIDREMEIGSGSKYFKEKYKW